MSFPLKSDWPHPFLYSGRPSRLGYMTKPGPSMELEIYLDGFIVEGVIFYFLFFYSLYVGFLEYLFTIFFIIVIAVFIFSVLSVVHHPESSGEMGI